MTWTKNSYSESNRLIALSEEEAKKGQHQNLSTLPIKDGEKRIVSLKGCLFSALLIAKVFKNEDDSTGTLYLVMSDLESSWPNLWCLQKTVAQRISQVNQAKHQSWEISN